MLRGSTVSLNCTTDANPAAHMYQFYFNDTRIGNSSSGLFNVAVDADGLYSCFPINTVGTGQNATVSITTVGKSNDTTGTFSCDDNDNRNVEKELVSISKTMALHVHLTLSALVHLHLFAVGVFAEMAKFKV